MAVIQNIKNKLGTIVYPKTLTKAVYEEDGTRLDNEISAITSDISSLNDTTVKKNWVKLGTLNGFNKTYTASDTFENLGYSEILVHQYVNGIQDRAMHYIPVFLMSSETYRSELGGYIKANSTGNEYLIRYTNSTINSATFTVGATVYNDSQICDIYAR